MDVNTAIIERLEKVVSSLQENSVKMGQLLAVHNEKLDKQDRIDAVLFEKVESLHREVNRRAEEIKKGHGEENVDYLWCSYYCIFHR